MREKMEKILGERVLGRGVLSAVLAVMLAVPLGAMPALAAPEDVAAEAPLAIAGVDQLEPTAEQWELMRLDNYAGQALYISVERTWHGSTESLAVRQKYTPGEEEGADGGEIARIVALDLAASARGDGTIQGQFGDVSDRPSYTIAVHDAQRGGSLLYEGAVYPVYAQLKEDGSVVAHRLMGIRTASTAEAAAPRNLGVGTTYVEVGADAAAERATYGLARAGGIDNVFSADDGCFLVSYERVAADEVTGSVSYVDPAGNVVRTDTYPGVSEEGVAAPIEQSFFAEAPAEADAAPAMGYYRVIAGVASSVQLTWARPHATVRVMEVPAADAGAFQLTVRYEDEDGALLWKDQLDVKGDGYQYTLPDTFSTRQQSGVNFYTLASVGPGASAQGASREGGWTWGNPLQLSSAVPATAFGTDEDGNRTLTAVYTSSDVSKEATFTLVEVDGSTGTVLGRVTDVITPEHGFAYLPEPREVNGVRYVPWSGNMNAVGYEWADLAAGIDLLQYVYYVPEDYVPGGPYDITVQYQNIADGTVLSRETLTVDAQANQFVEILGPERFTRDGAEYVRLAGQETAIRHGYFSPARTYTVYYRDVNDVINADTVITRTQIIETERTVTVPGAPVAAVATATPADAVAATAAGAGVAAEGGAAAVPDAGVGAGDATTVIDDDENPLATLEGQTPAAERTIEDGETPLSAGAQDAADESGSSALVIAVAAVGTLVLAAVAGLLLWRCRRRGNGSEDN